jgi:hypothetical protein
MCEMKSKSRGRVISAALRSPWFLVLAVFLLHDAPLHGLDSSISGSYKTYLNWTYDPLWQGDSYGVSTGILRLKASIYPSKWSSLELAYLLYPEIRPASLQDGSIFLGSQTGEYRLVDLRRRLLPWSSAEVQNIGLYNELDRAAVTFHLSFADLSLGRQAVAWGSARVINPTDVIVPLHFSALDSEYRKGVDAVRLRIPFGSMNEVDAGCIFGEDFRLDRSAAFARMKLYVLDTDVSLLTLLFKENLMVGLDLARAIGDAGAWLEAAYVIPDIPSLDAAEDLWAEDYLRLSTGLDYNFSGDLYAYLEYHLNSPGEKDAADYLQLAAEPAYGKGGDYLLGRHYLSLGATYQLTPLLPASALVMLNLNDLSVMLSLSLEYNIKENIYLEGGCTLGLGGNPLLGGGEPVEYRSEFGAYPNLAYTAVKLYF